MKLLELEVRNLGLYRDAHRFDFTTGAPPRNLVLVTGHNGAGKTTLFSAFGLALHGRLSFGDRVSDDAYRAHVLARFHRYAGTEGLFDGVRDRAQTQEAGVRLAFEYVRSGRPARVDVHRTWRRRGAGVEEDLVVLVDGHAPDAHREDYQAFLNDLVPPGVGFLCFFDAERLDALSHPDNATLLAEAVRRLLGLDVVRRLRSDLERYSAANKSTEHASRGLFDKLFDMDAATQADHARQRDVHARLGALDTQLAELQGQTEELERRIAAEGGGYAERRERFGLRRAELDAIIETQEARLAGLATGLLPFALAPELCRALDIRLERESRAASSGATRDAWNEHVARVADALESPDFWLNVTLEDAARAQLRDRFLNVLALPHDISEVALHPLSEPERTRLRAWLLDVNETLPREVVGIARVLADASAERAAVQADLDRVPDEDVLRPLHEELARLAERTRAVRQERDEREADRAALDAKLAAAEKKREQALADLEATRASERRLELAAKGQLVLRTFEDALARQRLEALEGALVARFNALCRKDQLLDRARIDSRTFQVQLRAADGAPLLLESFSAGERQLFGLSLLWALRDVTKHDLPLVIDTPLGRLDQLHRERMMRDFVPAVSDQVVLLTTDAELDDALFDAVRPQVARAYRLAFDAQHGETRPSETSLHAPALAGR
ncbi:DNA sulfur modification protein DndD [Deinococcus yavapaiensis]|uniref:DNA sulfur modification protein DndD n=1 Tax=Deinococcus yavapaiensis KR-236 TaxID=694435 RepID=A0A318S5Z5_9DEIO|nr:DNA sulfur modification protein DndD [Deinococcus yavapaiensis]PYE54083.1 DNA sulfur modification protein DndD [Deinococcus yavapaiensis KR-236]